MNIQEATKLALEQGMFITRKAEGHEKFRILPTNSVDCFVVYLSKEKEASFENFIPGKRWNPKAEDILANDWEVKLR